MIELLRALGVRAVEHPLEEVVIVARLQTALAELYSDLFLAGGMIDGGLIGVWGENDLYPPRRAVRYIRTELDVQKRLEGLALALEPTTAWRHPLKAAVQAVLAWDEAVARDRRDAYSNLARLLYNVANEISQIQTILRTTASAQFVHEQHDLMSYLPIVSKPGVISPAPLKTYSVILEAVESQRLYVMKAIRQVVPVTLSRTKELVSELPSVLWSGSSREVAEFVCNTVRVAGASVSVSVK